MMNLLKRLRMACLLSLLVVGGSAIAADPDACVSVDSPTKRPSCAGGYDFKVRNSCGQAMDIRVCLERSDKPAWNCGVQIGVKPRQEGSWLVCPGTGRYKAWGRSTELKTLPFPEEKGDFRRQAGAIYSVAPGESKESACKRAREFASGACECEARSGSTGFRCRVKIENSGAEAEAQAKPFAADAFRSSASTAGGAKPAEAAGGSKVVSGTYTAKGANETEACAELRRMARQPDLACTCRPAGNVALCRAEAPMTVPERDMLDTAKDTARDLLDGSGSGSGAPKSPYQGGGSGRRS